MSAQELKRELRAALVDSFIGDLNSIVNIARKDASDISAISSGLRRFDLAVVGAPELLHREIAPVIHQNREHIKNMDVDHAVYVVKTHPEFQEKRDSDAILTWVLEWWKIAAAPTQNYVQRRLLAIADDYTEWIEEKL